MQKLIHPFIEAADTSITSVEKGHGKSLVEYHEPAELKEILKLGLPENGEGKKGLMEVVEMVLKYSVNTWDRYTTPPVDFSTELDLTSLIGDSWINCMELQTPYV